MMMMMMMMMMMNQSTMPDPVQRTGLVERLRDRVLRREVGDFLFQFHWQVFVTLTFASTCTSAAAHVAIMEWLPKLGPDVYAYVGYEKGPAGGRIHCHALVGGLFRGSRDLNRLELQRDAVAMAKRSWRLGDVDALPYDPKKGAAWYVSKYSNDGEVIGVMKRHRPHRRRQRSH